MPRARGKAGCWTAIIVVVLLIVIGANLGQQGDGSSSDSDQRLAQTGHRVLADRVERLGRVATCFDRFNGGMERIASGTFSPARMETAMRETHDYCMDLTSLFRGGECDDALSAVSLGADQIADALEREADPNDLRDARYFADEAVSAIDRCRPELASQVAEAEQERDRLADEAARLARQSGGAGNPISVPSDPAANYTLISIEAAEGGLVSITNQRDGPSGRSYARRLVDCRDMTFRYTGDSDTLERLRDTEPGASLSPLFEGSISYHISRYACDHRP